MTQLQKEIRDLIVRNLELEIGDPEKIQADTPLFDTGEGGLGLDSLEALEIIVSLSSAYGVEFDEYNMEVIASVESLAAFVEEHSDLVAA